MRYMGLTWILRLHLTSTQLSLQVLSDYRGMQGPDAHFIGLYWLLSIM